MRQVQVGEASIDAQRGGASRGSGKAALYTERRDVGITQREVRRKAIWVGIERGGMEGHICEALPGVAYGSALEK